MKFGAEADAGADADAGSAVDTYENRLHDSQQKLCSAEFKGGCQRFCDADSFDWLYLRHIWVP
jgi:hypothetical protein